MVHIIHSEIQSLKHICCQMRQLEAVAAGALRREQAADATAKRLAAEIEQLTRLVNPKPFLSSKP
jgi:hypothetical protein